MCAVRILSTPGRESFKRLFVFRFRGLANPAGDKLVKVWSPHTGQLVRSLTGHSKGLSDIAWSSDSVFLASASDDTTIRIWTVDTVRLVYSFVLTLDSSLMCLGQQGLTTKILKGHTSYVFCVNYNSASDKLVSGCCDGDMKIWDVTRGKPALSTIGAQFVEHINV